VVAIAVGLQYTCAVMTAGGVKCWGFNGDGELGDGTTTERNSPTDVPGLSGVVAITASWNHTCVLTSVGGVKCWGRWPVSNSTSTESHTPVAIAGLESGVVAVVAGYDHNCVRMSTGAVKCWGRNQ